MKNMGKTIGNPGKLLRRVLAVMMAVILVAGSFSGMGTLNAYAAEPQTTGDVVKIACVGDSLTEGYKSSGGLKSGTAYPAQLQNLLGSGYQVQNFGKSSMTLMKGGTRSYWDTSEYTNSLASEADIVLIMLGTNDCKAWNEAKFKEDAIALVESYKAMASNPRIVFATSPKCYQTTGNDITSDKMISVNAAQNALIEEQGWDTIDMWGKTVNKQSLYNADLVHFTDAGYLYVAECMYEAVTGEAVPEIPELDIDAVKESAAFVWEAKDEADEVFNGTRVVDQSTFAEAVHKVNTGSIVLRFKSDSDNPNNSVLLAAKNSAIAGDLGTGKDCTTMYLQKNNQQQTTFRFAYKHTVAGIAHDFADGDWHSVMLSSLPTGKAMRLTIDGVELWSNTSDANRGMFTKLGILNQLTVGGYLDASGNPTNGFKGRISQIIVTSEVISDKDAIAITRAGYSGEIKSGSNLAVMFRNAGDPGDNSWIFTGGEAVWGPYSQNGNARNYMGHIEEYIRSQKSAGDDPSRQRYTINTAKEGQTLADIVANWSKKVTLYKPKAVAYMVGVEDYNQGTAHVNDFKASLKQFIDKALAEKPDNGSFAVIQKPFAVQNADVNTKIQEYCNAVDEVVAAYNSDSAKYDNIFVVDHFTQTKDNAAFKADKLNADGSLNELGHLEIGRQFVKATMGIEDQYPCSQGVRMGQTPEKQPDTYLKVLPTVTGQANGLQVTIPEGNGTSWKYILEIDGILISDTVSGNSFTITDLPTGKNYVLKIQSTDGSKQLTTTKGVIAAGVSAEENKQVLNDNQKRLAKIMAEKDEMTWLFMGDSITHGLVYTYGYAGTAQTMEKYVKDVLGRKDDVVINTAVSGAWTVSTLNNIDQRLEKYVPDVVAIMLGTNDAYEANPVGNVTPDMYEANMRTIIEKIRAINPEAIIALRCPTPMTSSDGGGIGRRAKALLNMERMKKIAEEDSSLIYIDQYTEMNRALQTYPWLGNANQIFLGNWLHPGINGQIVMAKQLIKGLGLWSEDNVISNLYYQAPIAKANSTVVPSLQAAVEHIGVSLEGLRTASSMQLGSVTIRATKGTKSYETTAEAEDAYAVLKNLPVGTYTVSVSSYLKNEAKIVTFASQEVTLHEDDAITFDMSLSNTRLKKIGSGTVVGKLSVDELAPGGQYTYTLCEGQGSDDNELFEIAGTDLKVKRRLTEGQTYSVRVKAVNGSYSKEKVFTIYAVGRGFAFEKSDLTITSGSPVDLSNEPYAEELLKMTEGTVAVEFTSTSDYIIQSLFSIANSGTVSGDSNRHFHIFVTPSGALGCEIRNNNQGFNLSFKTADGVLTHGELNRVALKADRENKQYKLFANGELVLTVDAAKSGGFYFVSDIAGTNSVMIGATNRSGQPAYTFGGTISSISVYRAAMEDSDVVKISNGEELSDIDKSEMEAKIAEAEGKVEADYTVASWARLQEKLAAAKVVLGKAEVTQEEINAAADGLIEALSGLEAKPIPVPVDKKALNTKIAEAEALKAADYTTATWSEMQAKLTAAKAVAANAAATQEEVNTALTALDTAIKGLVKATVTPGTVPVTGVALNVTSKTMKKGETLALTATVTPADATEKTVTFSTSDPKVAMVSGGKVIAMGGGTAVITATTKDGGKTAICTVTVPYTIKYVLNKGKNNKNNPAAYDGKALKLQNPTRSKYIFKGWYSDSKLKKKVTSVSGKDITVYAKWAKATPKATAFKKVKNTKGKKIALTYKKVAGAKYEITYATDKKMKKTVKKAKANKTSYTIKKGLKKGKTYYVRIRTFQKDSAGKTFYSKYSKIKKVKISK